MKNKTLSNGIVYVVISLLLIGVGAYAYTASQVINVSGDYNYNEAENQPVPENQFKENNLGVFPGPNILLDQLEYGSSLSKALNFTSSATSTPGSVVSILNAGRQDLICRDAIVNIPTADTTGGPIGTGHKIEFSLGTSTVATGDYGFENTPGIIASSTVATGTPVMLSKTTHPGSGIIWNGVWASSTLPFIWSAGTYIVGTLETVNGDNNVATASSTAVDGYVGKLYLDCFVE